jgi:hypothetical protein
LRTAKTENPSKQTAIIVIPTIETLVITLFFIFLPPCYEPLPKAKLRVVLNGEIMESPSIPNPKLPVYAEVIEYVTVGELVL